IVYRGERAYIRHNQIHQHSLVFGYGETPWGNTGINVNGAHNEVAFNQMDSIAAIGIELRGDFSDVHHNLIRHSSLLSNQTAAIMMHAPGQGQQLRHNLLMYGTGEVESLDGKLQPQAYGIRLANAHEGLRITHNTIAHFSHSGLFLQNNRNCQLLYNTLFANPLFATDASSTAFVSDYQNTFRHNTLVELSPEKVLIHTQNQQPSAFPSRFVEADSNTLVHPFGQMVVLEERTEGGKTVLTRYSLQRWQNTRQQDLQVTARIDEWPAFRLVDTLSPNMLYNSDFNYTITDWSATPDEVILSYEEGVPGMEGGCLKVYYPPENDLISIIGHTGLSIQAGQVYALSFKARSDDFRTVRLEVRQENSPWQDLGFNSWVPLFPDTHTYTYLFRATASSPQAGLRFHNTPADPLFWLDDVYLHAVEADKLVAETHIMLVVNPHFEAREMPVSPQTETPQGEMVPQQLRLNALASKVVLLRQDSLLTPLQTPLLSHEPAPKVYPNPVAADGVLHLGLPQRAVGSSLRFELLDTGGRLIWQGRLPVQAALPYALPLAGGKLRQGLYMLLISRYETGELLYTGRLMVE
ncbi:MAG: right-handed parallel beta-helix repeat-containing protein, partial [Bacteroidetes bacterium]